MFRKCRALGSRNTVVAPRAAVLNSLVRFHKAFVLQLVKSGIESAFLEIQYTLRTFLDSLGDPVAVARLVYQGFQNQRRKCPLEVHPRYLVLICIEYSHITTCQSRPMEVTALVRLLARE